MSTLPQSSTPKPNLKEEFGIRLAAMLLRDIFERDFETEFETADEARRSRESLILQLLSYGYEVTLAEPTWWEGNPR
jgi:hypothetical protein